MTILLAANLNDDAAVGLQVEDVESRGGLPAYPKYRNSGVEWLGFVPEHWALGSLKHLAWIRSGRDYKDVESPDGEYPVIGSGGQFAKAHRYLHDGESVLLGRKGTIDKPLYIHGRFWAVDTMFYTEIGSGASAKFIYYNALTIPFQYYSTSTALPSMTQSDLLNHPCAIPALEEQAQIARFLDHETTRIDALIDEQKRLIELLKEKRQALISHAVTMGLDPAVPMKNSGVEGLGEVPDHWIISNIDYCLVGIADVDHYMPQSVEKGVPYVMTGDLKEFARDIDFDGCKQVSCDDYLRLSGRIRISRGDVIMARYATIGTVSYVDVDTEFLVSYSCVTIKPDVRKVSGLYLFYYFKSNAFLTDMQRRVNVNTQGNVGVGDIRKLKIVLPTLPEQLKIIDYLNSALGELDAASDLAQATIALAKEKRFALISAAVTGKIDVRGWQPPASAPTPELAQEAV